KALRSAGVSEDDPAIQRALIFVERCQNFNDTPVKTEFDDGGFFFIHDDSARNKAGVAGVEPGGRTRYLSYGSTTAAGFRALLLRGRARTAPRVTAARNWLELRFDANHHSGSYALDREAARSAVYYYYAASVAQAFRALGKREIVTQDGPLEWAPAMAQAILKRQNADGSFTNSAVQMREDDPLVAPPKAMFALSVCREFLADGNSSR